MIYRALYTCCNNGIDFQGERSMMDGAKLFATGGNMGLSRGVLDSIGKEIKRDIYPKMRLYRGEAYRFCSYGEVSVLTHYRYMLPEETGSREFGIAKALIGNFDHHPVEYLNPRFFQEQEFLFDYPDAGGNAITSFRQLLTFQGRKVPQPFNALTEDMLFQRAGYPVISFPMAGRQIGSSEYRKERLRAAVAYLVNQSQFSEDQRKGIVIRGTWEEIRDWFAAIGYAFSAHSAQQLSFSIGLPLAFSASSLVGWLTDDPELPQKGASVPRGLVFLEDLPAVESQRYYTVITQFDDMLHRRFVMDFLKRRNDAILSYPNLCNQFADYLKINGDVEGETLFSLENYWIEVDKYVKGNFFLPQFAEKILAKIEKIKVQEERDLDIIIQLYSVLRAVIRKEAEEAGEDIGKAEEDFQQQYVRHFKGIFTDMLSGKYSFCERSSAKTPFEYFQQMESDILWDIADALLGDKESFDQYRFSLEASVTEKDSYLKGVVYPRLTFLFVLMTWLEIPGDNTICRYICHAFETVLVRYGLQYSEDEQEKLTSEKCRYIYKNIFHSELKPENCGICEEFNIHIFRNCEYKPQKIREERYDKWLGKIFFYKYAADLAEVEQTGNYDIGSGRRKLEEFLTKLQSEGFLEKDLKEICFERMDFRDGNKVFYYVYMEDYAERFFGEDKLSYWKNVGEKMLTICCNLGEDSTGGERYDKEYSNVLREVVKGIGIGKDRSGNYRDFLESIKKKLERAEDIYKVRLRPLLTTVREVMQDSYATGEVLESCKNICRMIDRKIDRDFEKIIETQYAEMQLRKIQDSVTQIREGYFKYPEESALRRDFPAVTRIGFYFALSDCSGNSFDEITKRYLQKSMDEQDNVFYKCTKTYQDALKSQISQITTIQSYYLTGEFVFRLLQKFFDDENFCIEILDTIFKKKRSASNNREVADWFYELYTKAKEDSKVLDVIRDIYQKNAKDINKGFGVFSSKKKELKNALDVHRKNQAYSNYWKQRLSVEANQDYKAISQSKSAFTGVKGAGQSHQGESTRNATYTDGTVSITQMGSRVVDLGRENELLNAEAPGFSKNANPGDAAAKNKQQPSMVEKPSPPQECLTAGQRNVSFGSYSWRVLDVQDGKALLLAEDILEKRRYHSSETSVTWENCELREYLNGEFLRRFCSNEQDRIAKTENRNENNQWYCTSGGADTEDKVFLLSIEEVVKYFGDSGQLLQKSKHIDDQYNNVRKATCQEKNLCWWLRSPGHSDDRAANVYKDGKLIMVGCRVAYTNYGIRPALWLNLQ